MADSNPTRRSEQLKQLTPKQFMVRFHKLHISGLKPTLVDTAVVFYHNLLIQAMADIKQTNNSAAVKFPLAMAYFAIAGLLERVGLSFKPTEEKAVANLNFYFNVMEADKILYKMIGQLNEWLLCLHRFDIKLMVKCCHDLFKPLGRLVALTGHDLNSILYLAIQFYKRFPFFSKPQPALGGLATVRGKAEYRGELDVSRIPLFMRDYLATCGQTIPPDISINISEKLIKKRLKSEYDERKKVLTSKRRLNAMR